MWSRKKRLGFSFEKFALGKKVQRFVVQVHNYICDILESRDNYNVEEGLFFYFTVMKVMDFSVLNAISNLNLGRDKIFF